MEDSNYKMEHFPSPLTHVPVHKTDKHGQSWQEDALRILHGVDAFPEQFSCQEPHRISKEKRI